MTEHRDVVVVGGGQAGLAVGYFLAEQGRRFTILEAAGEPAAAWRERWDSLKLFTPVRYDSLPGRAFPGDPDSHPGRDQVVAYLEDYAGHLGPPVELNSRVVASAAPPAASRSNWPTVATRPIRSSWRPGRGRCRSRRRSPPAWRQRCVSFTASPTGARASCPTGPSWSRAAATRAIRSPRSSAPRARCI